MPRGYHAAMLPQTEKRVLFRFGPRGRRGFDRGSARAIEPEDRLAILHDPEFVPRDDLDVAGVGLQQIDFPLALLLQELLGTELGLLLLQLHGEVVAALPLRIESQPDEQYPGEHDQNRQEPVEVVPDGGVAALFRQFHSGDECREAG